MNRHLRPILFSVCALACLIPFVPSAAALLGGAILGVIWGNPWPDLNKKLTQRLLALSIVGLGAGMNLSVVGEVGAQGALYTVVGIGLTLVLGTILGKLLRAPRDVSILVSVGTAICGGSAIAAVAPVIRAKHQDVTVALATVFILNALALLIFPWIGHSLDLNQVAFGLWSALAIHDTSSVVGSTLQYGAQALEVGTTVKLARALWIVPVTLLFARFYVKKDQNAQSTPIRRPWFILGFVIMAAAVTWIPALQPTGKIIEQIARRTLVLTLFLIGSGITRATLKSVGVRPLIQGILLWILVASCTLVAIGMEWISIDL